MDKDSCLQNRFIPRRRQKSLRDAMTMLHTQACSPVPDTLLDAKSLYAPRTM